LLRTVQNNGASGPVVPSRMRFARDSMNYDTLSKGASGCQPIGGHPTELVAPRRIIPEHRAAVGRKKAVSPRATWNDADPAAQPCLPPRECRRHPGHR
jgi:hypothetical protein